MKKINERKLIAEIRKKSLKAAGGGIAQLVKAKHIQDLCKQWKLTPLELAVAAGEFVAKEKNRLRILYRNPNAIIALMMIIDLHGGVKQSFYSKDAAIWRKTFFKFIPKDLTEATWRKLVNQIKQDFKMTRAGNYRKKKFIPNTKII
tara:strand:- start:570 stop:1010 length:441 start_codon:yes stop_codon:yes gene_type:complete